MTIAVSAIVRPSRLLRISVFLLSCVAAATALALALSLLAAQLPPLARFMLSGWCGFMAGFGFCHGGKPGKTIQLAISGTGQIRIREAGEKRPCTDANRPHVEGSDELVRLLPGSTLWPHLLLLRLQEASGKVTVVTILPDSVATDSFRALSAALRWIAARAQGAAQPRSEKIL